MKKNANFLHSFSYSTKDLNDGKQSVTISNPKKYFHRKTSLQAVLHNSPNLELWIYELCFSIEFLPFFSRLKMQRKIKL